MFNSTKMLSEEIRFLDNTSVVLPPPHYEAHKHYISGIDEISCNNIVFIKKIYELCEFVKTTLSCNETPSLVNYVDLVFCGGRKFFLVKETIWVFILGSLTLLSIILMTIISTRYVSNLLTIIEKIGMSQYNSGALILCFINGLPSIIAHSYNIINRKNLFYAPLVANEMYGVTMYLTIFQCGLFVTVVPFIISSYYVSRDLLILLFYVCIYFIVIKSKVSKIWGIAFILMYCAYVALILLDDFFRRRPVNVSSRKLYLTFTNNLDDECRKPIVLRKPIIKSQNFLFPKPVNTKSNIFIQFKDYLNPRNDIYCGVRLPALARILMLPFQPIVALFVPIVDVDLPLNGWCKLASIITLLTTPALTHIAWGVYFCGIIQLLGLIAALVVAITTHASEIPKYHVIFAFYGVICSVFLIYLTTYEMIGISLLLAYVAGLSNRISGATVLTFVETLSTVITNILITKKGFKCMTFASYMSSGVFHIFFIVGLLLTAKYQKQDEGSLTTHNQDLDYYIETNSIFLFNSIIIALFGMSLSKFNLRRSTGIFFLILYLAYFTFLVLVESEVIHAYGTLHSTYNNSKEDQVVWAK